MSFLEIKDIKNKEKLIKDYLNTRQKIKSDYENKKISDYEMREETEKIFKPVTSTLNKNRDLVVINNENTSNLLKSIEGDQSKVLNEIKNLKQPKLIPISPLHQKSILPPPLQPEKVNNEKTEPNQIKVSQLIASYLKDPSDKSQSGYSIKYHKEKDKYFIGNKYISFNDNQMAIKDKKYNATSGLMELMIKSNPDKNKITEEDYKNYKQILIDTNAIYQGLEPTNRIIPPNRSIKYKIIMDLFPEKFNSKTGDGIEFLPSDPTQLFEQLQLSSASYHAGNNGEYNRINSILDSLLKMNVITSRQYENLFKKVFG